MGQTEPQTQEVSSGVAGGVGGGCHLHRFSVGDTGNDAQRLLSPPGLKGCQLHQSKVFSPHARN